MTQTHLSADKAPLRLPKILPVWLKVWCEASQFGIVSEQTTRAGTGSSDIEPIESQRTRRRSRLPYLTAATVVLVAGWSARVYSSALPAFIGTYAPDTLWTLLVFLLVAAAKPSMKNGRTTLIALCFAYGIEFSQLYQAQWINDLRATRLGGLILGHGFLWSDLLCYSVGIGVGVLFDRGFLRARVTATDFTANAGD